MGLVKYVINLLGFNQDNKQGSRVHPPVNAKRKRAPEEEEDCASSDAGASHPNKNSLHTLPPVKRAKMEDTSEVVIVEEVKVKSPIRRGYDALKSLFVWQKKVEQETLITRSLSVPDVTESNQIETVDLIGNYPLQSKNFF